MLLLFLVEGVMAESTRVRRRKGGNNVIIIIIIKKMKITNFFLPFSAPK